MKIATTHSAGPNATDQSRSWATSHLGELTADELSALVQVMGAWYHQRAWKPKAACRPDLLWEYIDRHGLGGVLGAIPMDVHGRNKRVVDHARHRYFSNMLYFEQAKKCCLRIQKHAAEIDVPVIFIKGPVLTDEAYRDVSVRAFADIDLMVPSREAGYQLAASLGVQIHSDGQHANAVAKVRNPARLMIMVDQWEIEIRYPMPELRDPLYILIDMLDFSKRHKTPEGLYAPALEWHIVFLVLHMATYHYFSRFVWFLDLAAVMRSAAGKVNIQRLTHMLAELSMINQMAAVSSFCRQYIDPQFPRFDAAPQAWNYPFMKHLSKPRCIAKGRFNKEQETTHGRLFAFFFSVAHLFLLTDPPIEGPQWLGAAGAGIGQRLRTAVNIKNSVLKNIFEKSVELGLLPTLWLLARGYSLLIPPDKDGVQ